MEQLFSQEHLAALS